MGHPHGGHNVERHDDHHRPGEHRPNPLSRFENELFKGHLEVSIAIGDNKVAPPKVEDPMTKKCEDITNSLHKAGALNENLQVVGFKDGQMLLQDSRKESEHKAYVATPDGKVGAVYTVGKDARGHATFTLDKQPAHLEHHQEKGAASAKPEEHHATKGAHDAHPKVEEKHEGHKDIMEHRNWSALKDGTAKVGEEFATGVKMILNEFDNSIVNKIIDTDKSSWTPNRDGTWAHHDSTGKVIGTAEKVAVDDHGVVQKVNEKAAAAHGHDTKGHADAAKDHKPEHAHGKDAHGKAPHDAHLSGKPEPSEHEHGKGKQHEANAAKSDAAEHEHKKSATKDAPPPTSHESGDRAQARAQRHDKPVPPKPDQLVSGQDTGLDVT